VVIAALPREVVDRIAAGEVVERPASVVKELVENALDAGATTISVSIEGGGLDRIRVADDGHGLGEADILLAFTAHATSKLVDVHDLAHIGSFGFRGEALASIGAVSRCRLTSSTDDSGGGLRIDCAAGEVSAPSPVAAPHGTVLEVADLFFNTPARREFLGAVRTESARCRETVQSLSLEHRHVRFRFEADGQVKLKGGAGSGLSDRVAEVYGREFADELLPVTSESQGMRLEGLLSRPSAARSRARAQLLFVNGRLVRDRAVTSAVRVGCKDLLPGSLHPSWVLSLSCDPAVVDVNVHPTKAEVRFRDREALFSLVRRACRDALLGADLRPHMRAEHLPTPCGGSAPGSGWGSTISDRTTGPGGSHGGGAGDSTGVAPPSGSGWHGQGGSHEPTVQAPPWGPAHADGRGAGGESPSPPTETTPALFTAKAAVRFLQVLDTYLVHDGPDGLVLVDQHALHERILYARLQGQLERGEIETQRLLVPQVVRLDPVELEQALQMSDELARSGLSLERFGADVVSVTSVPAVLRGESIEELLRAFIGKHEPHGGVPHGLDRRLFTLACHAAVRAGDPLDEATSAELLEQGAALEHDATCPHGRPTRLVIGKVELERLFKRSGF